MAKRLLRLTERQNRRNFVTTNKVGQLGRQGVHGPVEQRESLLLKKPFQPKSFKPKGT